LDDFASDYEDGADGQEPQPGLIRHGGGKQGRFPVGPGMDGSPERALALDGLMTLETGLVV
jgi:hypothetical protein